MNIRYFTAALAATILSGVFTFAPAQDKKADAFREAVRLYDNGSYERAAVLFSSMDGEFAEGYKVLSDIALKKEGYEAEALDYLEKWPESKLCTDINWKWGSNLFDEGKYTDAAFRFTRISETDLDKSERVGYLFRRAYSEFAQGNYSVAEPLFFRVLDSHSSDYDAPSSYCLGYMAYSAGKFKEAFKNFKDASDDIRFEEIASYYMLECRFMMKDYDYVIDNGTDMFLKVPEDRQPHMARIISEAYLVKGDVAKAKEYYEKNLLNKAVKNRADYFYSGSVLYAVKDYQGAIDNFTKMGELADSLGQIAFYELGYSYIETKDKVSALESFRNASSLDFDPNIKEDAYFNFAKLAFDINHDTSSFEEYLKRYGGKSKGDKIYNYMAMAALYNHDYEGAVAAYDNIDELDEGMKSNYMKAYFMRANQLIGNGAWRDAVPCLKAAAYYSPRQNPFNQLSRFWLAESLYHDEKYSESRNILTDLYNLSALDGKAEGYIIPYDIAYTFFKEGDYMSALKWFNSYMESGNDLYGSDAMTRIGDCYFFTKDYRTAVAAFERKLSVYPDPNDVYPYFRAGVASGLLGEKERKVKLLENVKEASPTAKYFTEAMYELGRAYVETGNDDDAIRTFKTLRSSTTDNSFAAKSLIELGMISRNRGEYSKSLDYYKQVVETMAGTEYADDALVAVESLYRTLEEPDAYLAYVNSLGDKAGRDEAQKDNAYFGTAEQIFMTGNYDKALSTFENYLQRFPGGLHLAQAEYYMGECNRSLGRKEKAIDWFSKAVDDGAEGSFKELSMLGFASLSYSIGRYDNAFGGYSALVSESKLDDNRKAARIGMMRSAYKAKRYDDAIGAAEGVKGENSSNGAILREADYLTARSYLESSRRDQAFALFEKLSLEPSTVEGAEASYLIIQDLYDRGRFDEVEDKVYAFAPKAGSQSYWLAKAFIVLGDSFAEKGNLAQAKATFESVKNGYKPSAGAEDDVLDQIDMRLAKLNEMN